MKKSLITSAFGIALAIPMMASAYSVPELDYSSIGVANPASFDSKYDWKLSLDADDFEALKTAKKSLREQVRTDLQNASDEEKNDIRAALKAKRAERRASKSAITDEQKESLKTHFKSLGIERSFGKKHRGHGKKRFGRNGEFKEKFQNLTDEQRTEIQALRAEFKAANQDLSREEKREMRKTLREKVQAFLGQ